MQQRREYTEKGVIEEEHSVKGDPVDIKGQERIKNCSCKQAVYSQPNCS